jgi:hypothetical protein
MQVLIQEVNMDVSAYCDTLEKQLSDWKAKLYDVIRGLHSIVDEIDSEVEQLRSACPADWSPNRQNIDDKMAELQQTLKNLSEDVGGPLIPDSLSWVSK